MIRIGSSTAVRPPTKASTFGGQSDLGSCVHLRECQAVGWRRTNCRDIGIEMSDQRMLFSIGSMKERQSYLYRQGSPDCGAFLKPSISNREIRAAPLFSLWHWSNLYGRRPNGRTMSP